MQHGPTATSTGRQNPFSLVGGTTSNFPGTAPPASFYGGVTLESFGHNADRLDHLTGKSAAHAHNFPLAQIALLINPDSSVGADESLRWPSDGGHIYQARDKTTIQSELGNFAGSNHTAIIISADPFFTDNLEYVIQQANGTSKHVCYPFQEYANASAGAGHPHPTHNKHTLHGPKLLDAYQQLGQVVASVISSGAAPLQPKLEPAPPIVANDP